METDRKELLQALRRFGAAVRAQKTPRVELLESTGNMVTVDSTIRISPLVLDDFPALDFAAKPPHARLDAGDFAALVGEVAPAASKDEARPILTGCALEPGTGEITLTATDSYRLHTGTRPASVEQGWSAVVPARALVAAAKMAGRDPGEVTITVTDHHVVVASLAGRWWLGVRTIAGSFPSWRQLMPAGGLGVTVDAPAALADAVAAAKPWCLENAPVIVRMTAHGLTVEVHPAGIGNYGPVALEADVPADQVGAAIALNRSYLADALKATGGAELRWPVGSMGAPTALRPMMAVGNGIRALIMPVRLPASSEPQPEAVEAEAQAARAPLRQRASSSHHGAGCWWPQR